MIYVSKKICEIFIEEVAFLPYDASSASNHYQLPASMVPVLYPSI